MIYHRGTENTESTEKDDGSLSFQVIGAAMEVHKQLGPGLLESTYEMCFCHELALRDVPFQRQVAVSLNYKGMALESALRLDMLVKNELIVELKAIEKLLPIHEAQLLTYLRLSGFRLGLLINFNVPVLRDGIRRLAN